MNWFTYLLIALAVVSVVVVGLEVGHDGGGPL